VNFDLVDGQRLMVDTGCMVTMDPTVAYDVQKASGLRCGLMGVEGFFVLHDRPQACNASDAPLLRTAERIVEAAGGGRGEKGGLIGNIFGG
jgi:Mitochondrial biogenesis AIM24